VTQWDRCDDHRSAIRYCDIARNMENHGNFAEKIPAGRSTQSRRMPKRRLYCDVPDAIVSAEIQDPGHPTSHRFEVKKYI